MTSTIHWEIYGLTAEGHRHPLFTYRTEMEARGYLGLLLEREDLQQSAGVSDYEDFYLVAPVPEPERPRRAKPEAPQEAPERPRRADRRPEAATPRAAGPRSKTPPARMNGKQRATKKKKRTQSH